MKLNRRYTRNIRENLSFYIASTILTIVTLLLYFLFNIAGNAILDFSEDFYERNQVEDAHFTTYMAIPEEELAAYMDNTIEAATYKGTVYQLPIYYETLLFMYNRLYMSDEEVPATTEELYAYMQENTKGGHYGFVEQHSTPYYAAGWINGFGGYLLNDQGEPGLNSPETEEALTYHKKFAELMPGETEYATVNTLFKEGMAHATIAGPWLIPTVRESGMDVGIAPMPVIDETGTPISPYMGVQGIQVLRNAAEKKPEAVEKVLRALMSDELLIDLAKASGCAPARESCYEQESITGDEVVMAMKETAENTVPMPNLPEMDGKPNLYIQSHITVPSLIVRGST